MALAQQVEGHPMNITNRMRVASAAVGAFALACAAATLSPAHAADTTTTFTLTAGTLTISAPASGNLGSVTTGTATTSAQLGSVAVTDNRGALLGSWTASVSTTDFTTGGATSNETIAKTAVDYWSGVASTTGTGVFTPGQTLVANKVTMSVARTAYSATGVVGLNTATWNPTMIVNIPSAAVAGVYSGTVTHSVA